MLSDDKKDIHKVFGWQLLIALVAGVFALLASFIPECPPDKNFCMPPKTFDYQIYIKTGKHRNASTEVGGFYLLIKGESRDSELLKLDNPKVGRKIEGTDKYLFPIKDLGEIKELVIGFDDTKKGHDGWLLESVKVIKNETGSKNSLEQWEFKCGKWLQTDENMEPSARLFPNGQACIHIPVRK